MLLHIHSYFQKIFLVVLSIWVSNDVSWGNCSSLKKKTIRATVPQLVMMLAMESVVRKKKDH